MKHTLLALASFLVLSAGLAFGQTVLSRAVEAAGRRWDAREAHSAVYDTERTAELFCDIINRWKAFEDQVVPIPA